ncbi:DUF1223 domain-containing protein [Jannaschia sp. 2305UL9-9]|uniref:DUF1223 domain-containing protein n=1 Tax=Jannaschia sp. 2305UL9-9 TaxID=3121638 RepID=UPI00352985EE
MRFALLLSATLAAAPAVADPVVVELFTSQGCSSCPPADDMLGELADRSDVIALSLHVDYWDWIGWADTFAKPGFSQRQRDYASVAGSSVVYTPQFVIGGQDQVAGPSGMQLAELIDAHRGRSGDVLRVASGTDGRKVMAMESDAGGQLILVTVLPEATVPVLHGENAGRDMTYHNVVTGWEVLTDWSGEAMSVVLPSVPEDHAQFVLAQSLIDGKPGAVIGAVRAD